MRTKTTRVRNLMAAIDFLRMPMAYRTPQRWAIQQMTGQNLAEGSLFTPATINKSGFEVMIRAGISFRTQVLHWDIGRAGANEANPLAPLVDLVGLHIQQGLGIPLIRSATREYVYGSALGADRIEKGIQDHPLSVVNLHTQEGYEELILAALATQPRLVHALAKPNLTTEMVKAMIRGDPESITFIPRGLIDEEIADLYLSSGGRDFDRIPLELQTHQLRLKVLEGNYPTSLKQTCADLIRKTPSPTHWPLKLLEAAIPVFPEICVRLSFPTEAMIDSALAHNPRLIASFPERKTPAALLEALRCDLEQIDMGLLSALAEDKPACESLFQHAESRLLRDWSSMNFVQKHYEVARIIGFNPKALMKQFGADVVSSNEIDALIKSDDRKAGLMALSSRNATEDHARRALESGYPMGELPVTFRSPELIRRAIELQGMPLGLIPSSERSFELCEKAVRAKVESFRHVPQGLQKELFTRLIGDVPRLVFYADESWFTDEILSQLEAVHLPTEPAPTIPVESLEFSF